MSAASCSILFSELRQSVSAPAPKPCEPKAHQPEAPKPLNIPLNPTAQASLGPPWRFSSGRGLYGQMKEGVRGARAGC